MSTIRVSDLTDQMRWRNILSQNPADDTKVNGYQNVEKLKLSMNNFFHHFRHRRIKIGSYSVTPGMNFEQVIEDINSIAMGDFANFPFKQDPYQELMDSLCDESDTVWFFGAGGFGLDDALAYGKSLHQLVKRLETNISQIKVQLAEKKPKQMFGFCVLSTLMTFLQNSGIGRQVHAPLCIDFSVRFVDCSDQTVSEVLQRLKYLEGNPGPLLSDLSGQPCNDVARSTQHKPIQVTIGGGVSLYLNDMLENPGNTYFHQQSSDSGNLPAAILIEGVQTGFEEEEMSRLRQWLTQTKQPIAAVLFGQFARTENKKDDDGKYVFDKTIASAIETIAADCQEKGIAVFKDLPVGHVQRNLAIPLGPCTLQWQAKFEHLSLTHPR